MFESQTSCIQLVSSKTIKHEGVVRIRRMRDGNCRLFSINWHLLFCSVRTWLREPARLDERDIARVDAVVDSVTLDSFETRIFYEIYQLCFGHSHFIVCFDRVTRA